jgi:hypothetical protein
MRRVAASTEATSQTRFHATHPIILTHGELVLTT